MKEKESIWENMRVSEWVSDERKTESTVIEWEPQIKKKPKASLRFKPVWVVIVLGVEGDAL